MSTCKICGAQVKEGELYCGFCSAPVESENTYQQPQNYGRPSQSKIRVSAGEEYYDQFRNQTQSQPGVQSSSQDDYCNQYDFGTQSQPRVQSSSQDDYCNQYDYGTQSRPKVQSYPQNDYYNQYGNQMQQDNGMYDYNTNSNAKPVKSGKGKSLQNRCRGFNIVMLIFGYISSLLGLGMSITGLCAPYWEYPYSEWCEICGVYEQKYASLDCDIIAVLTIAGICIFGIMLLLSIAGTIMNIVSARKNNN